MATFKRFEDIGAWQKAKGLAEQIYFVTKKDLFNKDCALRDQMRRAAVSVMAHIAEGFERGEKKEFIQFLSMAKGSAGAIRSHLYVALGQSHIDKGTFESLFELATETGNTISSFMDYLCDSKLRGKKFQTQSYFEHSALNFKLLKEEN